LVANRDTNTIAGVTLWDTLPDPEQTKVRMQRFQGQVTDITAGLPAVTDYEVMVEV